MTNKSTRRLSPTELAADEEAIIAIKNLVGYTPVGSVPTVAALLAMNANVKEKQEVESSLETSLATARDSAITAEWERHEAVINSRTYVRATCGRNSDEVKAVGLKRQMDRKRPTRRVKNNP